MSREAAFAWLKLVGCVTHRMRTSLTGGYFEHLVQLVDGEVVHRVRLSLSSDLTYPANISEWRLLMQDLKVEFSLPRDQLWEIAVQKLFERYG